ncbi:MAG TPA: hypothetical protein VIN58_19355, partial [Roseateles sp.]
LSTARPPCRQPGWPKPGHPAFDQRVRCLAASRPSPSGGRTRPALTRPHSAGIRTRPTDFAGHVKFHSKRRGTRHLGVDRVQYGEIDLERGVIVNVRDFFKGDLPSHVGQYDLARYPAHAGACQGSCRLCYKSDY